MNALLEYHHPSFTPFSRPDTEKEPTIPEDLLNLVVKILAEKPTAEKFPRGKGLILVEDDAAGDPASLGTHCLTVLNAKTIVPTERVDMSVLKRAIEDEMEFLLEHAPKVSVSPARAIASVGSALNMFQTDDGAISHRLGHVSLWADFIYMASPLRYLYFYPVHFHFKAQSNDVETTRYLLSWRPTRFNRTTPRRT